MVEDFPSPGATTVVGAITTTTTKIKSTNAAVQQQRVIKLKYIAAGFLLFNLLYMAVMFIVSPAFAHLLNEFKGFAVFYVLAVVAAALAIRDGHALLLYPILLATAPIIGVTAFIWMFYLSDAFYCALTRHSQSSLYLNKLAEEKRAGKTLDDAGDVLVRETYWSCASSPVIIDEQHKLTLTLWALIAAFACVLICIEKIIEFIVLRRLMKAFWRMRAEQKAKEAAVAVVEVIHVAGPSNINNNKDGAGNDTDEDVLYAHINSKKQLKDELRTRRVPGQVLTLPPPPSPSLPAPLPTVNRSKRVLK